MKNNKIYHGSVYHAYINITPEQGQVCNFDHVGVHVLFWTDDRVISVGLIVYSVTCISR